MGAVRLDWRDGATLKIWSCVRWRGECWRVSQAAWETAVRIIRVLVRCCSLPVASSTAKDRTPETTAITFFPPDLGGAALLGVRGASTADRSARSVAFTAGCCKMNLGRLWAPRTRMLGEWRRMSELAWRPVFRAFLQVSHVSLWPCLARILHISH